MTPKEAYKAGFLLRCAEKGLAPEEIENRIRTVHMLKYGEVNFNVGRMLSSLANAGLILGIGGPIAAGGLGGYLLAKMNDDTASPGDLRKEEEIEAYDQAIARLKMLSRAKRIAG